MFWVMGCRGGRCHRKLSATKTQNLCHRDSIFRISTVFVYYAGLGIKDQCGPKAYFSAHLLRSGRERAGRVGGIEDNQVNPAIRVVLLAAEKEVVKRPSGIPRNQARAAIRFNSSLESMVCLL